MAQFGLSEMQAKAILDMRLQRLTGLERAEDRGRVQRGCSTQIAELQGDPRRPRTRCCGIIRDETARALKEQYGDERRTEIVADEGETSTSRT